MNEIIMTSVCITSATAAITLIGMTLGRMYADREWSKKLTEYFQGEDVSK
jgi:hypothetical protein